jgi:hypothetical protein
MNQIFRLVLIGICLLFFTMSSFAKNPTSFNKPSVNTDRTLSNIGNWSYWMYEDGQSGIDPDGNSGGIYPRGTAGVIYEDGFVWGGFLIDPNTGQLINDPQQLRVGGQTYRIGTQPGQIINGQPDNPANNRIFRIRTDWQTLSIGQIAQEIAEAEGITAAQVTQSLANDYIAQYRTDWNEWPTDKGAPYVDVDGNGTYDPITDGNGDVTTDGDYPGIANADQVVYTVVNDLNDALTTDLYGSQPIGLELQVTAWAYNQPGAGLGQLIFKKYKLINKSEYIIDSMYVSQWCDPDVGNYSDDVVGCDTTLSVGFAYNFPAQDASFLDFNLSPSVVGFDFFQGPLVEGVAGQDKNKNGVDDASDYALFNLQDIGPGYINLPMTSFGYFAAGSVYGEDPDLGKYKGTREWYNLLRGFGTISDDIENPVPFQVGSGPNTGQITKFPLSGDPVNDPDGLLGDIDAKGANPGTGDRRMCLSTGPFNLPQWDDANGNGVADYPDKGVQEIVVAIVGGNSGPSSSGDGHKSVGVMKDYDVVAQALFNSRFTAVPKAPPSPVVDAVPYRKSVVLEWGSDLAAVAKTEAKVPATGYDFQGYNVYQMPSSNSSKDESVLIATFDLVDTVGVIWGSKFDPNKGIKVPVAVQLGKNSGVQRYLEITKDYIDGTELYPGRTYYFAVTAYNFNPAPTLIEDQTLESALLAKAVVPQGNLPGERYSARTGDDIEQVTHSAGGSDGQVFAKVVDPSKLTGGSYEVFFTEDTDTNSATYGQTLWSLRRAGATNSVVANQTIATSNEDATRARPIVDGVEIVVTGPPPEFKSFQVVANANGPVDPPEMGCFAFNSNGFPLLFNSLYPDGTDRPDGSRQQSNGSTWGFNAGGGDGTWDVFLSRTLRNDNADRAIPYDFEMRFTAAGGMANWYYTTENMAPVPFELWNIGINTPDDPSDDFRMTPLVLDEVDENDVYDYGTENGVGLDSPVSGGSDDPYLDWVYWYNPVNTSPGTAGYDDFVANGLAAVGDEVWARTILINWNGGDVTDPTFPANVDALLPETGTVFRIITNKPNTTGDVFSFTAPAAPTYTDATAKTDVNKINVYPNPYYANNSEEIGRFERFVTFNHLPVDQTVTIRIFALNGVQVRKLEKADDASANEKQFLRWDLTNEAGLPVASGIYIAYVDMPTLGKTKVLKLFIVQPAEILQYF